MKTIEYIQNKKSKGERIVMLTAYDYPMARVLDYAGVDIILVGDSLANVVLGLDSTKEIGMAEMLHHTKAVARGVKESVLIGDMPYGSYEHEIFDALRNAKEFMAIGCQGVKLEWFDECIDLIEELVDNGIPVMGHVGLTPQSAKEFKVQGKDVASAQAIIAQAKELEEAGCFAIVLECIPKEVSKIITEQIDIPTIGIGAGVHCDGQVLVTHDLLGYFDQYKPKFVRKYVDMNQLAKEAVTQFCEDVRQAAYPTDHHSFKLKDETKSRLIN